MVGKTVPDNRSVINGKAVTSLTLGILSILIPFLGLIIGILSLVFYRKARKEMAWTGEGGRGLAIAGLNCSIAGISIQILLIIGYLTYTSLDFV